jgi:hypothetical protein
MGHGTDFEDTSFFQDLWPDDLDFMNYHTTALQSKPQ